MTFRNLLLAAGCAPWAWLAAAPGPAARGDVPEPDKPLESLIHDLSDEHYKVREAATRTIWQIGEAALSKLTAVADGDDPEAAYRARELVRKITLHITPDTDPEVIRLVERYAKASVDEKQELLGSMIRKRAWRQILGLFADEKNPEIHKRFEGGIGAVAVTAARESLLEGKTGEAREFLEMAPADAAGLLALANFHRSQGTLDAEIARAKTLNDKVADNWLLALYRASGNLQAAKTAATAAGETGISAVMAMMLGDPEPWLQWSLENAGRQDGTTHQAYTRIALERWRGGTPAAAELKPLFTALKSASRQSRLAAIYSLYQLGEVKAAEEAYVKLSKTIGFTHYESLERIPEALEVFGLDPEHPDFTDWVAKRFAGMDQSQNDPEQVDGSEENEANELLVLATFMDSRGMTSEFQNSFVKPLEALAQKDEQAFLDFMTRLFGANHSLDTAPDLVRRVAYDWAGENQNRWDELFHAVFGDNDSMDTVWDWLAELDPDSDRMDRFDAMLALVGAGTDPMRLRDRWLDLAWQVVGKAPEAGRKDMLSKLGLMISLKPDVGNNLKLWATLPEGEERDEFIQNSRISELTIAGRWGEAADIFLKQLGTAKKFHQNPSPMLHAGAAACLRKAGRLDEAAEQDRWVDQLYLGNGAYQISIGYRFGDDYERSSQWLERAVRDETPLPQGDFRYALRQHGTNLLDAGRWKEAAAALEVSSQIAGYQPDFPPTVIWKLTLRLEADLAHALSILKTDRHSALTLLDRAYAMAPGSGVLADHFLPAVRDAGLIERHDAWFKESWDRLCAVAERYPGASNTLNTAAWLGARSQRNLDAARKFEERALALKPDESSYLDTMAEIEFAAGNRPKALEWSERAVSFAPGGFGEDGYGSTEESFLLRRQREHFRVDPLPR